MKKILWIALVAVAMFVTSCGNSESKGEATPEGGAENETTSAKYEVYDNAEMTLSYPKGMKVTYEGLGGMNAANSDGSCKFSATFNATGPTEDQLEMAQKNHEGMITAGGSEIESSNVDGKIMLIRSKKESQIEVYFLVLGEGTKCISGKISYPADSASVYDADIDPIVKAMKVK